tara:strand:+ start:1471 stop:2028 length:558 start_codon:yes stop_codon:yes gene_type:complete
MRLNDSISEALRKYGRKVILESRKNLNDYKKGDSDLFNSIRSNVNREGNSMVLTFTLPDYWTYVNYGVKGIGGTKADGTSWQVKNVTNSPYAYKDKGPSIAVLDAWASRKGITPDGFGATPSSRESMLYAISKSVLHTGVQTTNFFTDALTYQLEDMENDLEIVVANSLADVLKGKLTNNRLRIN